MHTDTNATPSLKMNQEHSLSKPSNNRKKEPTYNYDYGYEACK